MLERPDLQAHISSALLVLSCMEKVRTRKESSTLPHLKGCFDSPEKQGSRPLGPGDREAPVDLDGGIEAARTKVPKSSGITAPQATVPRHPNPPHDPSLLV